MDSQQYQSFGFTFNRMFISCYDGGHVNPESNDRDSRMRNAVVTLTGTHGSVTTAFIVVGILSFDGVQRAKPM
jgi:hypothetical protein